MVDETEDWLEQAQQWAARPVPLAPYWEGRTFEESLSTSVQELASEAERAMLYERLFALIDRKDPEVQHQALTRLSEALHQEVWEDPEVSSTDRIPWQTRLEGILLEIERRLPENPDLLEQFLSHFTPTLDKEFCVQIRNWLNRLEASGNTVLVPANALLAARILYGAYGATWREAGDKLMTTLHHEDLNVRACAANQLGIFCHRLAPEDFDHDSWPRDPEADRHATEGMASLEEYWALIRTQELQRPGVAGAFWMSAPTWTIDADEWVLTLLEQSGPEPFLLYFPCNLGFDAHERFSRNPAAIRRLMAAGRLGIALEAATEANEPVKGLKPLLIELGENDEPEVVRLASWTLAYYYRYLHPNGARLGFVQRHVGPRECDLFLLFPLREEPAIPYAVVLYPKPPRKHWTREEASALVDLVFPPAARGEETQDALSDESQTWYRRGFVHFAAAGKWHNAQRVVRITIGYRSSVYWNPVSA